MVRFWGFHSDMFNVLVILTKWLLATFETSFFSSDVSRFFSFNVIFWSHCEPFSLKKGLQSYLISFETQFFGKSFLAFLFNLNARFLSFFILLDLYSSQFLFALFFIPDLQSQTKFMKQCQEIKKNWTGQENFESCFCVIFDH